LPAERRFIADVHRDGVDGAILQDIVLVYEHGFKEFVVQVVVAFDDYPGNGKGSP